MAEGFKFTKRLTPEADDLVIRAMVRTEDSADFCPLTFRRERIDYVTEVSEGVSGIALKNGAKIAVAMPYEELERRIYFADVAGDPLLDLRAVTGAALEQKKVPELAHVFAEASAKKPFADKPLRIAVFARQEQQQNFQMFSFLDAQVNWAGAGGASNGVNGPYTRLPLREGVGPFGVTDILIDMPHTAFMELYNKAKMDGADNLDLRDLTRSGSPAKARRGPSAG